MEFYFETLSHWDFFFDSLVSDLFWVWNSSSTRVLTLLLSSTFDYFCELSFD